MGRIKYLVRVQHVLKFFTSFRTLQGEKNHRSAVGIIKRGCGHMLMPSHFFPDLGTVCHEFCKIKFR